MGECFHSLYNKGKKREEVSNGYNYWGIIENKSCFQNVGRITQLHTYYFKILRSLWVSFFSPLSLLKFEIFFQIFSKYEIWIFFSPSPHLKFVTSIFAEQEYSRFRDAFETV